MALSEKQKAAVAALLEDDEGTEEDVSEVTYKGKKYRRVADDEDEPQPVKKTDDKAPTKKRFLT